MLDTTASAKRKSTKIKEISFQDEIPSLGPSKPFEKKTYQNFADLYESSGESDLNSSKPNKITNKNEGEKSYRSMVFHNKNRGGKENENVKTPKNKKNRSISEPNVTNADTPVTKKKSKHSSISEESANFNASHDNSFIGKKKNKNKHLDLTYNPQITSTPTTDALNKSKLLNNTKNKSVILNENVSFPNSSKKNKKNKTVEEIAATETDTPEKGNIKRNRKKSKSIENDATPKKIKTDENIMNEIEDANEITEKLKNKDKKAFGDGSNKNKEKKRKALKSETENQEQIDDINIEAVSEPKKKKKNRNKNKNVEQKVSETEQVKENENLSEDDEMFANAQPVFKKNKVKTAPKEGQERPTKKGKNKKKNDNQGVKGVTEEVEGKTEKSTKKWNKHNKYTTQGMHIAKTTLFVENLPLNLMLKYKPTLKEHFGKYGPIRNFGVIELYPMEDPRPVFSTTVRFHNEDSAEKALQEDNMVLEGRRIRVRPMLPAQQTTIVAKGKGLTEQAVSTIFAPCGRLRSIRIILKGKNSKYQTAFIEFDGPEAVVKALKVAPDASVCGKPVMVSRYEPRSVPEPPGKAEPDDTVQGQGKGLDEGESEEDD